MAKKTKKTIKNKRKKLEIKIDIGQTLLSNRQIFLTGHIDEKNSSEIIKQLMILDRVDNKPITLYINSGGGQCSAGFSIIDTISGLRSPIITVIIGCACSMAALIAVAGTIRFITENSYWMAHDGSVGFGGKMKESIDYSLHVQDLQNKIFTFLRKKTKLTEQDISTAMTGHLWLDASQCLKKNVVDRIARSYNAK